MVEIDVKIPLEIHQGERIPDVAYCCKWYISAHLMGHKYACTIASPTEEDAIKRAQYRFQKAIDLGINYEHYTNSSFYPDRAME